MTLTTYPLDDYDYSADDAALFHCTRTSGIYAGEDFAFSVSGADNIIKISPGLAWMRINRFKGLVAALKNETSIDLGLPDSIYPRIDRVALQFSANKNGTEVVVKKGVAASNPLPPERSTSEALFELHLLEVRREPGSVSITSADIKDLRLDESCCGLMADSVTNVDTEAINAQVTALIEKLREKLAEVEGETYYASKEYVDGQKLIFNSVSIPVSAFVADTTYQDYGYRAAVSLEGVISSMVPEVVFGVADVIDGNFSPVAETYDGGVYIYAASPPESAVTVPTIIFWRGA